MIKYLGDKHDQVVPTNAKDNTRTPRVFVRCLPGIVRGGRLGRCLTNEVTGETRDTGFTRLHFGESLRINAPTGKVDRR